MMNPSVDDEQETPLQKTERKVLRAVEKLLDAPMKTVLKNTREIRRKVKELNARLRVAGSEKRIRLTLTATSHRVGTAEANEIRELESSN